MTTKPQSDADVARSISKLIPDAHQLDYDEDDITALIAQHVAARLAETAKEWGVTLDKNGQPLSRDVCHTLLKHADKDLAARTKPLVEALKECEVVFEGYRGEGIIEEGTTSHILDVIEQALAQEKAM